jgi:GNAT superfamily N-acetyltransferase
VQNCGKLTFRSAEIGDADAWARIVTAGWRWAYRGIIAQAELDALDIPRRAARFAERLDTQNLSVVALDAERGPVGFAFEHRPCSLEGFDVEIGALYVDPECTRSGIGKQLVERMAEQFRARGASSMAIHTLAANRIGRGFYEKIGGKLVHEDLWDDHPAVWYGYSLSDLAYARVPAVEPGIYRD